jgi:hypothetical protein
MSNSAGTTVNERLFSAGLLPEWDAAVADQDRRKLAQLLDRVQLKDQSPEIIESALRND